MRGVAGAAHDLEACSRNARGDAFGARSSAWIQGAGDHQGRGPDPREVVMERDHAALARAEKAGEEGFIGPEESARLLKEMLNAKD